MSGRAFLLNCQKGDFSFLDFLNKIPHCLHIARFSTSSKDKKGICNKKGVVTCLEELVTCFYLVGVTELVLCS